MADTAYEAPDSTVSASSTRAAEAAPKTLTKATITKQGDGSYTIQGAGVSDTFPSFQEAFQGLAPKFGETLEAPAEEAPEVPELPQAETPPAQPSVADASGAPVSMSGPAEA